MRDLVPMFVAIAVMFAVVRVARRRRDSRHAGARTVRLAVDDAGVTRELADGRVEHLAWERLVSVEGGGPPRETAHGARARALLARHLEGPVAAEPWVQHVEHDPTIPRWYVRYGCDGRDAATMLEEVVAAGAAVAPAFSPDRFTGVTA